MKNLKLNNGPQINVLNVTHQIILPRLKVHTLQKYE